MFSYRHAFHAGNHADVLKHLVLLATLRHLVQKDGPLALIDTHAGAGLYRLDGDHAQTSGEAQDGFLRLAAAMQQDPPSPARGTPAGAGGWSPALQDYRALIARFNTGGGTRVYPGSPLILHSVLRERDKLRLYELHPTDARHLDGHVAQLQAGRQVTVLREDGFEALHKVLPPPQRRGLVLCDPSYELKTDYARLAKALADALGRFATGTYLIWYPIIPRPEAHGLPKRLRALAEKARRPWLQATLTVKGSKIGRSPDGRELRPGLPASGMFVINPPFTLRGQLAPALAQLVPVLAQDRHAAFTLDAGG